MPKCGFDMHWVSCSEPVANDGDRCEKHTDPKCECCGKPATRMCGETSGPFCCPSLLCEECTHVLDTKEGCNVFNDVHVKPGEPNGVPWYLRDGDMSCATIGCTLGGYSDDGIITVCTHYGRRGCKPMSTYVGWLTRIDKIPKRKHLLVKKHMKRALADVRKTIRRMNGG